jgi:cellulose synthase/poly-beta-1,6-N-acetylglucosamine synthase-like glycosyltransferase
MIESILIFITTISVLLVLYHHLGYPLILKWVQRHHHADDMFVIPRHYSKCLSDKNSPTITLVIPAFNEQQWITDKILNCATLDYPSDKIKVIIACDGCTDKTVLLAQQLIQEKICCDLDIEIRDYEGNRGKVALLNTIINTVDSDLVALSDVSALISLDALLIAAAQFKLKNLGVINSHYCLLSPGSVGEASYWQYQSKIKLAESSFGSTLGAHGAFYLFRRELFKSLAFDTINDDFILPMQIVADGYVAKQDNRIMSVELETADEAMDWQRRVRIAAGNLQQVLRLKRMLLPHYGGIAFTFISGKALRVVMPFLMMVALAGSLILAPFHQIFLLLAVIQISIYVLVFIQTKLQTNNKLLKVLIYLVNGHAAGMIGALTYLFKNNHSAWRPVYSKSHPKEVHHEHSI